MTPKGTLVLAGGEGAGRWLGMGRVMRAKAMSPFVGQKMTNFLARPKAADLTTLKELIEADKIKPVIGSRYSLGEVPRGDRRDRSWTRSRKGRHHRVTYRKSLPAGSDTPIPLWGGPRRRGAWQVWPSNPLESSLTRPTRRPVDFIGPLGDSTGCRAVAQLYGHVSAEEADVSGASRSRFRPAQMVCSERRPMLVIIGLISLRPPCGSRSHDHRMRVPPATGSNVMPP
jgi:hypothetical protein